MEIVKFALTCAAPIIAFVLAIFYFHPCHLHKHGDNGQ